MNFFEIKTIRYITFVLFVFTLSLIIVSGLNITSGEETFIFDTFINQAILNTLLIGVLVTGLSGIISYFFAFFNVYYDYPFKRTIHILSIVPMAIPCYIMAYNYNVLLSHGGELSFLNLDITNVYGAVVIYTLSFYPYLYMMLRSSLKKIPFNVIEAASLIDNNIFTTFRRVIMPLSIKAFIAGSVLVLAEVFSDIGVVEYFNIQTLSTVIKQTYVVNNNYALALKVGFSFGLFMIFLFVFESFIYKDLKYGANNQKKIILNKLSKLSGTIFYSVFFIIFMISFFIPIFFMIIFSIQSISLFDFEAYMFALFNTVSLTLIVSFLIIIIAIFIGHVNKFNSKLRTVYNVFNIWYILPSVLIGLMITVYLNEFNSFFNTQIVSSLTISVLIIAYVLKYLPLGNNLITKSYVQVNNQIIEAAMMLKDSRFKTFLDIDVKLLLPVIFSSMVIIVTDVVKELTLVSILKPFNYQTLSTTVAKYAKDEMVQESAIYSLTIVVICLIAIIYLTNKEVQNDRN